MIKAYIIRLLKRWLTALEPPIAPTHPVDQQPTPFEHRVAEIVNQTERIEASGEYKKFQVCLARLKKEFPDMRKRDICLAIEFAVQKLP